MRYLIRKVTTLLKSKVNLRTCLDLISDSDFADTSCKLLLDFLTRVEFESHRFMGEKCAHSHFEVNVQLKGAGILAPAWNL